MKTKGIVIMKRNLSIGLGATCLIILGVFLFGSLTHESEGDKVSVTASKQANATEPATGATEKKEGELEIKALGDPDAPVTVKEFSSLTCGHCGQFHKDTFDKLKEEFIDTGKLYYVYQEFPLNRAAIDGALVARCFEGNRFWNFTELLYQQQKSWLDGDHVKALKQNAKLAGLGEDKVEECLADEDMANKLAENMQGASSKYGVNSTPTFIFNDGEKKLVGNQPIKSFRDVIEELTPEDGETAE